MLPLASSLHWTDALRRCEVKKIRRKPDPSVKPKLDPTFSSNIPPRVHLRASSTYPAIHSSFVCPAAEESHDATVQYVWRWVMYSWATQTGPGPGSSASFRQRCRWISCFHLHCLKPLRQVLSLSLSLCLCVVTYQVRNTSHGENPLLSSLVTLPRGNKHS